jgi:catalase (peroxidase I)
MKKIENLKEEQELQVKLNIQQEYSKVKFVNDFVKAWNKVMNVDRFDLNT